MVMPCLAMAFVLISPHGESWGSEKLEGVLRHGCVVQDYFPDGEPPDVPIRYRDALKEFRLFFEKSGWTTNQFVDSLIVAATNRAAGGRWTVSDWDEINASAIWKLSEIDHPAVTNFFRSYLDQESQGQVPRKDVVTPVVAMFSHTNLEPEVLDYMRTLCVRTNLYESIADIVMLDMFETLSTMPEALKPAATNRVAQYMYYAIRHTTRQMCFQDRELAKFIPSYSNSFQRLEAMRYVESTATNVRQRVRARMEIDRLTALPTNALNDVSWIVGE